MERVSDLTCTVGESPLWSAAEAAWYWVDIPAKRIWRLDDATLRALVPDFADRATYLCGPEGMMNAVAQARFRQHRADAQGLPKLAQGAQHRGFGQLAAQGLSGLVGGECPLFVQHLPQLQH